MVDFLLRLVKIYSMKTIKYLRTEFMNGELHKPISFVDIMEGFIHAQTKCTMKCFWQTDISVFYQTHKFMCKRIA